MRATCPETLSPHLPWPARSPRKVGGAVSPPWPGRGFWAPAQSGDSTRWALHTPPLMPFQKAAGLPGRWWRAGLKGATGRKPVLGTVESGGLSHVFALGARGSWSRSQHIWASAPLLQHGWEPDVGVLGGTAGKG